MQSPRNIIRRYRRPGQSSLASFTGSIKAPSAPSPISISLHVQSQVARPSSPTSVPSARSICCLRTVCDPDLWDCFIEAKVTCVNFDECAKRNPDLDNRAIKSRGVAIQPPRRDLSSGVAPSSFGYCQTVKNVMGHIPIRS